MRKSTDFVTMTDEQLTSYAAKAFLLGLHDGKTRSGPRDRRWLLDQIIETGVGLRKLHTNKLRQVYGAGFDIAFSNRSLIAREKIEA